MEETPCKWCLDGPVCGADYCKKKNWKYFDPVAKRYRDCAVRCVTQDVMFGRIDETIRLEELHVRYA